MSTIAESTPRVIVHFTYTPNELHNMTVHDISDALPDIVGTHLADTSTVMVIAQQANQLSRNMPDIFIEIEQFGAEIVRLPDSGTIAKAIRTTIHERRDWSREGPTPAFSMIVRMQPQHTYALQPAM